MPDSTPHLSVVICTYNRDRFIRAAVESLMHQDQEANAFEVIVVDNRSTDQTATIVSALMREHPNFSLRYVYEENKGLSHARNRGIREARSPVITYMDDDAEARPDFVRALIVFFQQHPEAVGAGGKVLPKYPDGGEPAWMSRYLYGFVAGQDHGDQQRLYTGKMKYPAGCNMSYRKEILEKAGGFNTQLQFRSDDKDIHFRIKPLSAAVWYVPTAIVDHNIDGERLQPASFRKLYLKTGHEEKIRIRTEKGWMGLPLKAIEYLIKWGVSLLIGLSFWMQGQGIKGNYLVRSQWYTLQGFFMKNVFVR